jgi:hypothetical protein
MSRRRGDGPRCTVIWWGDIPTQVVVRDGSTTLKAALPPRFQHAIDRAAMGGGQAGSDSYLAGWTRTERSLPGDVDLSAARDAEVAELERRFPDAELQRLIAATRAARRTSRPRPTEQHQERTP